MESNEELAKQVEVQCASLDSYHLLEEQWRKDRIKLESKIDSLTKINEVLIKLRDIEDFHILQEKWRKRETELELKVDSLTKINDALIKLGDRLQDIIEKK